MFLVLSGISPIVSYLKGTVLSLMLSYKGVVYAFMIGSNL